MTTRPRRRPPRIWRHQQIIALLLVVACLTAAALGAALYALAALDIPAIDSLRQYRPAETSIIYDRHGNVIARVFAENRRVVPLDKMPRLLPKAFVAAEDARFYQHPGVDAWSILRALLHNLRSGRRGQGGSTITQQVARALLLSPEKTYIRKVKEAILAYRIDKTLSKDAILNIYLNQIYLGEGAYGVGAAAQTYFGKPVAELSLAEIAILAGLPQAPSRYSPFRHFPQAKRRQAYVLNRMAEDGYITPEAARRAYKQALLWQPKKDETDEEARYFIQYVTKYINRTYGHQRLLTGGLRVHTTLDRNLQRAAARALRHGVAQWGVRQGGKTGRPEAALVSLEPQTGKIRAMMGGVNYDESQFNRAVQARRQPGSAFKPIVYAAALESGLLPNSLFNDEPITFTDQNGRTWKPHNYSGTYKGLTTLRNGLVHSNNIVSIKVLREVGVKPVVALARRLGIHSPLANDLSLALGSSAVSLLELTNAYAAFANQGRVTPPLAITRIEDRDGTVLEENKPRPQPALDPRTAFQITHILKGVIASGTGRRARGIPFSAGKTGTTDQYVDAWFIGYTPTLVTGVWMGHDRSRTLGKEETGGRATAPIWHGFMAQATAYKAKKDFPVPEGIVFIPIDPESGDFEYQHPDNALWEAFRKDRLPAWKLRHQQTLTN